MAVSIDAIVADPLLRRIARSAWIILSGNSIASALNVVSFALMARQVGAPALGIFALTQNYVLIINDIFNVQTWEALVKFCASTGKDPKTPSVLKANCYVDLASAVVGTTIAIALIVPVSRYFNWGQAPPGVVGLYCLTILFNLTSLTIGVPRLFNRFGALAKIQVVMAVGKLCAIAILWFWPIVAIGPFIVVYLLADITANIATMAFSLRLIRRRFGRGWWRTPTVIDREVLRFIWWTNLRTVMRIPVRHFDMLIIARVMPLEMVGTYRAYKEIAGMIGRVGDPVNQAVFPEFSRLINAGDRAGALQTGKRTVALMALASVGMVLPMIPASRFVLAEFFGPSYLGSVPALYMMIVVYAIAFASTPVNSLFIAAGFAKASFWLVTLTNSVYLVTAYLLGMFFGVYGIVAANAVQSLLNSGIKVVILTRPRWVTPVVERQKG